MRTRKMILATVFLLVLSSCVSLPPPPEPEDSQSAAIGISLMIRAPIKLFFKKTDIVVYFIRLDEEKGKPDSFLQTTLYQSNYTHDNQIYLLNTKPGRYAAVVAFFERTPQPSQQAAEFWTYFSEDLIRHTEITVPPGAIRYMGDFIIDQAAGMKNADEAQDYYHRFVIYSHDKMIADIQKGMGKGREGTIGTILSYRVMDPASLSTLNLFARVLLFDEVSYRGSANTVDRSPQTEAAFLKKASEHFQTTGWMQSIHKRLDELNAP